MPTCIAVQRKIGQTKNGKSRKKRKKKSGEMNGEEKRKEG